MPSPERPFDYHKPNDFEIGRIEALRTHYQTLKEEIEALTQPGNVSGRYVQLALTTLEESAMWATKSVVFERENDLGREGGERG